MEGKYVIGKTREGLKAASVFTSNVEHVAMLGEIRPKSAGFYRLRVTKGELAIECFGESSSLGITTAPGDGDYLARTIFA